MGFVGWVLLASLGTAAESAPLPRPPDIRSIAALAPRPTGDCNAAVFFEQAEDVLRRSGRSDAGRNRSALLPGDPALRLALRGMECRRSEFSYSRRMAWPPTEQPIPMLTLYRGVASRFVEDGRDRLRRNEIAPAEAEFRKAVVLGTLLYEDPGIVVIQDAIALNVLLRGVEGLGDAALARGDQGTAAVCARFVADARAHLEGVARFVRHMPYRGLLESPTQQGDAVAAVASLYAPEVKTCLRNEVVLLVSVARPLVDRPSALRLEATLERAARDADPRLRMMARWGSRLEKGEALRSGDAYEERGRVGAWLARILVNVVRERGRRAWHYRSRIEPELAARADEGWDPEPSPEARAVSTEAVARALRGLRELPDAFREVLVLRQFEERSTAEVAEMLEIPEATVRTRLKRARDLLLRLCGQERPGEGRPG
jgi:RNA polymerase sigma factor (sigma-70 family)